MSKILITGATGHLGGAVIDFLIEKGIAGNQIAALVRDEAKAENLKSKGVDIRVGSYLDYSSLVEAFKDIDKLLLVSSSDVNDRFLQHNNVIKAAKETGVKHLLYTSFARNANATAASLGELAQSHIQTEEALKKSGMDYTIVQNNLYLDFIPYFVGEKVLETNSIFLPAGNGKASTGLRAEYAEAIANILTQGGHENKEYSFTNTESLSYGEIAKIISDITGREIQYISPTMEEYSDTLTKAGVPVDFINLFGGFAVSQAQGELDIVSQDLETLLGRKPTTFQTFLTGVYHK